ncbi:maintenance of telomere capping protein 1 [Ceratobasidium sp. AG-Ba]|nr:maintenance of telomere capping protein 1 [Ceratobasidium sp. AG-Ba]QRW15153.1 maintenance of telomere capping protein 1 [Ceratobasidium sp. AG-Ba]
MSKSKQQEAEDLLNDLDSLPAPPPVNRKSGSSPAPGAVTGSEGAEALAFIDEITQKSSEPTKSTPAPVPKPTERIRLSANTNPRRSVESSRATTPLSRVPPSGTPPVASSSLSAADTSATTSGGPSGWGWGSVWTSASAALQQARTVVEEQAKNLPPIPTAAAARTEQARKWSEGMMDYIKTTQFDKISQDLKNVSLSTLHEIMNAVAPPISEHEVIQVWLSHDMEGYEGIESLVYRSLAKIMEQVEGGDLIVNRGNESRPKEGLTERDLNAVHSYDEAIKLAEAEIAELVKARAAQAPEKPKSPTLQNPTTYSTVYIRVQPFFSPSLPTKIPSLPGAESTESPVPAEPRAEQQQLQFLLYLVDPLHQLAHATVTQGVAAGWLGLWDAHDWVESTVVEVLRVGVEVMGQHYVADRMGYAKRAEIEAIVAEKSG